MFPNAFGIRPVAGVDDGGDGGINEGIEVTKDGRDEGWEEGGCEGEWDIVLLLAPELLHFSHGDRRACLLSNSSDSLNE